MLIQSQKSGKLSLDIKNEISIQNDLILGNGVEYVAIINKNGKIEDATYIDDINLEKGKKEMFSMGIQLQNSMQRDFDDEFGTVNYTITCRKNSNFVSMPISSGILVAKLDKSLNPILFIDRISLILDASESTVETCDEVYQ